MTKNKIILLVTVAFFAVIIFWFLNSNIILPKIEPVILPTSSDAGHRVYDLIRVAEPISGQVVMSPLTVKGEARGNWYFEASFPIKILDANGVELGATPAQAQTEWMTEDFVPFKAVLTFKKPATANGILVLKKDNPSGLPEHDAELRIPVSFDLQSWQKTVSQCRVTGCSGEICSNQDIASTCEYKSEYACYKIAKCEYQSDGKCGWTPSEELVACLYSAWGVPPQ